MNNINSLPKVDSHKKNKLFTTVTASDFKDKNYINQLIKLNVGLELALLTNLSNQLNLKTYAKDLDALKKEMLDFKNYFDQFEIPLNKVRIHQPGGYAYKWFGEDEITGFDFLKDFFSYCCNFGFENYTIHSPYGNTATDPNLELNKYRQHLGNLVPDGNLEVEEIAISYDELKNIKHNMRLYNGVLFEKLMTGQKAKILLDTYECDGINKTINRFQDLSSKGFEIKSMHLQKDKHKFLTREDLEEFLKSGFYENLINEGFIQEESSFDQFIKTKSTTCIVPNNQRIETLKMYIDVISKNI